MRRRILGRSGHRFLLFCNDSLVLLICGRKFPNRQFPAGASGSAVVCGTIYWPQASEVVTSVGEVEQGDGQVLLGRVCGNGGD